MAALCMKPPLMKCHNSLASFCARNIALFHSSPVLERRRRTNWDTGGGTSRSASKKSYNYSRRSRKMHSRHTLLRNVSEYAEHLFQSWRDDDDDFPSSSKGTSWFKGNDWGKGKKKTFSGSQGPQWGNFRSRGGFEFCFGDDQEVEFIFRSAFGGERSTYWSFINEEPSSWRTYGDSSHWKSYDDSYQWRSSSYGSSSHKKKSSKRKNKYYDDYSDTYDDDYNGEPEKDLASDRRTLGLEAFGPLNLQDVKTAYRACALKWHPDRHQGSDKANAEEKFKKCSAAYQSLCDNLDASEAIKC
ncbi:hypothetical protein ACHQM5_012252 [Ranunculus cassubicifolius]